MKSNFYQIMQNSRDDFSRATKEILAKRVGFLCSNPNCFKPTIGANEIDNKSTTIGKAAHITAAAEGGPRYDQTLTPDQRRHIDNGIWLCSNCADLIDKDEVFFKEALLREWKINAEAESRRRIGYGIVSNEKYNPILEADLIRKSAFRANTGYSNKNPIEIIDGHPVFMLGNAPIIYWLVSRNFDFVIYNNSNTAAFNLKIESIGTDHFTKLTTLPKINNLPPLQNIDLKANYEIYVEGDYTVADRILNSNIPEKFSDIVLKLTYYDERRNIHTNLIEFYNNEIVNTKV